MGVHGAAYWVPGGITIGLIGATLAPAGYAQLAARAVQRADACPGAAAAGRVCGSKERFARRRGR